MIKLNVEPYCHSCQDFQATVGVQKDMVDGTLVVNTGVTCVNRKRCATLVRYLEHQIKEAKNNGDL
jgi:hypothetical protein